MLTTAKTLLSYTLQTKATHVFPSKYLIRRISFIHLTAIIHPNVKIGSNVNIGPYCNIENGVEIEDDVILHSHVCVSGNSTVGSRTQAYPFSSIGSIPQDKKYNGEQTKLIIGKDCVIREHVSINLGTQQGGGITQIGDRTLIMSGCHVGHDSRIGNDVVISSNTGLAGHVTIDDGAIIGGQSGIVQRVHIGSCAMIGGSSLITHDVIPYGLAVGNRAHLAGLNLVGLRRRKYSKSVIRGMMQLFHYIFMTQHQSQLQSQSQLPSALSLNLATQSTTLLERAQILFDYIHKLNNNNPQSTISQGENSELQSAIQQAHEILQFILHRKNSHRGLLLPSHHHVGSSYQ